MSKMLDTLNQTDILSNAGVSLPDNTAIPASFSTALNPPPENDSMILEYLKSAVLHKEAEMRRKEILSQFNIRPTARGWYVRDKRINNNKKHECTTKEALEQYIIDQVTGQKKDNVITIEKIWDSYYLLRRTTAAETTVKMDLRYKERYIESSPIYTADVRKLKRSDALAFFNHCKTTKKNSKPRKGREASDCGFRKKYWFQIQAVLSAIWDYLIDEGYVETNIFRNLRIHKDAFDDNLEKADEETVFSESEAESVKRMAIQDAEAKKSAIPLGILLLFALGLRVGELCALKWKDIVVKKGGRYYLHVQREVVGKQSGGYKVLPHTKSKAGDRFLPLNDYCQSLFQRIKIYNANQGICITMPDEFIFQRKQKGEWTYCTVRSFDPRLRKYCRQIGMQKGKEKSPHDARRTCLTEMYDKGTPIKQLQYFAGHETVEQTLDYIRRRDGDDIGEFTIDDSLLFTEKPSVTKVTKIS